MTNPYSAPDAIMVEPSIAEDTYEPKFFSLHGRIGRLRYLAYTSVMAIIVGVIAGVIALLIAVLGPSSFKLNAQSTSTTFSYLYVALSALHVIVAKRRMNDLDNSGWFGLLMLVPFLNRIVGLYLTFARGTDGENGYGLPEEKSPSSLWIAVILIPVIGILAAVAIPAYQQYTIKARAQAQQLQQAPQLQQTPQSR